jgi:hypothetical protein
MPIGFFTTLGPLGQASVFVAIRVASPHQSFSHALLRAFPFAHLHPRFFSSAHFIHAFHPRFFSSAHFIHAFHPRISSAHLSLAHLSFAHLHPRTFASDESLSIGPPKRRVRENSCNARRMLAS